MRSGNLANQREISVNTFALVMLPMKICDKNLIMKYSFALFAKVEEKCIFFIHDITVYNPSKKDKILRSKEEC